MISIDSWRQREALVALSTGSGQLQLSLTSFTNGIASEALKEGQKNSILPSSRSQSLSNRVGDGCLSSLSTKSTCQSLQVLT